MTKRKPEIKKPTAEEAARIEGAARRDPDAQPLKPEQLRRMERIDATGARDAIAKLKRKRGQRGPQRAPTKVAVYVRLDQDIVDTLKSGGPGWQTRMNDRLREALHLNGK